jgi:Fe-S-cluster containining protein
MNALLNIPRHTNCKNCGECCGPVLASIEEVTAIRNYIKGKRLKVPRRKDNLTCVFRDQATARCMIYPVRPLICRMYGVVEGVMQCPQGNTAAVDGKLFMEGYKAVAILNEVDWRTG